MAGFGIVSIIVLAVSILDSKRRYRVAATCTGYFALLVCASVIALLTLCSRPGAHDVFELLQEGLALLVLTLLAKPLLLSLLGALSIASSGFARERSMWEKAGFGLFLVGTYIGALIFLIGCRHG